MTHRRQRGSALMISLIFLMLLTLLSVTSLQSTTLQEKMVGNAVEENHAFQMAEGALRAGEDYVQANAATITNDNVAASLPAQGAYPQGWSTVSIDGKTAYYFIQRITYGNSVYRITAIGYGADANARSVLQSTYRPR